ncbi:MAG: four helix bundle protein [Gemmatimonadaceae bacterium]
MQDHKKLRVWQRAHGLTVSVIQCAKKWPREMGWLKTQLVRATASIAANIAEGAGQETSAQFGRFLATALASSNEVSNHATVAYDCAHISLADFSHIEGEIEAIRAMLTVLQRRVRESEARSFERLTYPSPTPDF